VNRLVAASWIVVTVALLAFCAAKLRISTNITHFMPDSSRSELGAVAGRLADSPFSRTMVLSVGADALPTAIAAAGELAGALREHPEVAWVRSSVDDTQLERAFELYYPRRLGFLSDEPESEVPKILAEPALRESAREARRRLSSPAATVFESLVVSDPFGAFQRIVERLRGNEPALRIERGQFVTRDGRFAIVLLGTKGSAFDSARQGQLLLDLRESFDGIAGRLGGGLFLEQSGANRFAVAAETDMRSEVYVIAACSFLGVAALFFTFVGSLRGFLVVSVPPLAGILVATSASLALFGQIDGLTMMFGTSLMGIAIDYSNHLLLHHGLDTSGETGARTARRLRPSLVLGALTTVASFAGLAMTAFPAFREMSFFAGVGVATALLVTLTLLPDLLGFVPPLPARAANAAAGLARTFGSLDRMPRALAMTPLAVGLLAIAALPGLRWQDDMSQLTRFDPELVAEVERVRERVSQPDSGRFVIGLGSDGSAAVALNDRIHERLRGVIEAGGLEGTRSLHTLLWSEDLQRRNLAAVRADAGLYERVDAVFAQEGFRSGSFLPFREALLESSAPLTLDDLQSSPLADLLVPFVFPLGEQVAVVTYLRGSRSPDAIRAAIADLPGVFLLNQRTFVNDVYREFRETTLRQILVGGAFVLGLLFLRYRAWRPVVASFLPSALVAVLVLATLSLAGAPVNLLHVMSLIMVMGMGVDYGIFLVDSANRREDFGPTLLSLLMSCLTTAFVFGTLAFSTQPALHAIGVTAGLGIVLCYLFAPVVVVAMGLLARRDRGGG